MVAITRTQRNKSKICLDVKTFFAKAGRIGGENLAVSVLMLRPILK